jgi:hypothetical protein
MLRLRQGWIGFIGDFLAFGPLLWRYAIKPMLGLFSLGGDIDFYIQHSHESGWVGVVIDWLGHPIVQVAVLAAGLGLILWDSRRARDANQSGGDRFSATGIVGDGLPQRTWIKRVEPSHIIVLGLVIAGIGVGWQMWRGKASNPIAAASAVPSAATAQTTSHPSQIRPRYNDGEIRDMIDVMGALRRIVDQEIAPESWKASDLNQMWRRRLNEIGAAALASEFRGWSQPVDATLYL